MADIAAARMVVVLTDLGVSAQVAVDAAMQTISQFEKMCDPEDDAAFRTGIAIVDRSEHEPYPDVLFVAPEEAVGTSLGRTGNHTTIAFDLAVILNHVTSELLSGDYPALASDDVLRTMARVLADKFRPSESEDK